MKPIVTLPTEIKRHIDLGFRFSVEKLTVSYFASLIIEGATHCSTGIDPQDAIANLELALIQREAEQESDGAEEMEIERARLSGRGVRGVISMSQFQLNVFGIFCHSQMPVCELLEETNNAEHVNHVEIARSCFIREQNPERNGRRYDAIMICMSDGGCSVYNFK